MLPKTLVHDDEDYFLFTMRSYDFKICDKIEIACLCGLAKLHSASLCKLKESVKQAASIVVLVLLRLTELS